MPTAAAILRQLKAKANPVNVAGMARFGMAPDKRLGLSMPDLRRIAKETGRDHQLAQQLWETGIPEARILAGLDALLHPRPRILAPATTTPPASPSARAAN